jgi:hypothetical protein
MLSKMSWLPNPKHTIPQTGEFTAARKIACDLDLRRVSAAVNFHDHFAISAKKISKVRPDGRLPHKLESTELPIAQHRP